MPITKKKETKVLYVIIFSIVCGYKEKCIYVFAVINCCGLGTETHLCSLVSMFQ